VTGFAPVDFSTVNSIDKPTPTIVGRCLLTGRIGKKVRWFLQVLSDDEAFQFTIGPDTDRIEMDQDVKKWAKEYHISLGPTHPASGDEDSGDEDSSDGDSSDGDNGDEDSGDEESVSDNQTVLSRANTM
jgi:hypothetical protein